jgi:hypothetical protein
MSDVTLTKMQQELLRLFFELPEASDFLLAGAALIATGLSERATQDLDFFGGDLATGITVAADALEAACIARGWAVTRVHDSTTFRRIVVQDGNEELLVDLAVDSPQSGPQRRRPSGPRTRRTSSPPASSSPCSIARRHVTSSISTRCHRPSTSITSFSSPRGSTRASTRMS